MDNENKNQNIENQEEKTENFLQKYSYNAQETALIKQLTQVFLEQKKELEYENLEDYEYPPRTQFSMLKKPAVNIRYGQYTFNMACIRLFEGVQHVETPFTKNRKKLAVIPCTEEKTRSIEWARYKEKDKDWVNRTLKSPEFTEKIFSLMNWDRNCRYKALGRVTNSNEGLIIVFDLEEAIMFPNKPYEYIDKETGEKKRKIITYYPDKYKDTIGKSYNDYLAEQQMTLFEHIGKTYEDYEANKDNDFLIKQNEN